MSIEEGGAMKWDSAVIFAGGKSSRMGQDKALMPFGGFETLAEYQYRRLLRWYEHVYISAKEDKFPFQANLILDRYSADSPMVALASSLESVKSDEIFIISVDMPFAGKAIMEKLWETYRSNNAEIVIAASPNGNEPLCGIYATSVSDRAQRLIEKNEHRIKSLLDICSTSIVEYHDKKAFVNLNTPDEYDRYRRG